jgi:glycerophosphoryl diester phosphodiesterase
MTNDSKPHIIAHRGESFNAPENTLAAINLAWERGAEAVEIDIQFSKDRELVVIHDTDTKRLAGIDKKVVDQTLEELKKLDVGVWKDIQFKDEKIPTLKEVLDTIKNGKRLIIEMKSGPETISILKPTLQETQLLPEQIEIIGFDLDAVALAKEEFPDNKVLWLLDINDKWYTQLFSQSILKAIKKAKYYQLDGLNVFAGKVKGKKMIEQIHEAGLLVYCWTVNDIDQAKDLMDWGVDAITTDGAAWLSHHLFS